MKNNLGEVEKEQLGYFVGKSKASAEHPTDEANVYQQP